MYNVIEVTNEKYGRYVSIFKNYRSYILVKYSGRTFRHLIHTDDIEELLDIRHLDDPITPRLSSGNFRKQIYIDITNDGSITDEVSGWLFVASEIPFEDYDTARLYLETLEERIDV